MSEKATQAMQLVKKHKIAIFIKPLGAENYTRIKKSTTLTLSMTPVETDYDYIADENPTTEVEQYKPSIDQDLTMYKGSEDYEIMWPYFYHQKTGTDAHASCMIAFMQEPVREERGATTGYLAWETDAVISVQDMNAVEKKLNVKILFAGDTATGIATMSSEDVPVFTVAEKQQ